MIDSKDLATLFEIGNNLTPNDVKLSLIRLRERGLVNNRGGLTSRGSRVTEMLLELTSEYIEEDL